MPRERRIALSENLERFDKLDPAEQAAIRKLDAEIARKDPVEQARYRALLRRYHLWVNGLTEEQKAQLKEATGTEERFNLATEVPAERDGKRDARAQGLRHPHRGFRDARPLRGGPPAEDLEKPDARRRRSRSRRKQRSRAAHRSDRGDAETEGGPARAVPGRRGRNSTIARLDGDQTFKKHSAVPSGSKPPKKAEPAKKLGTSVRLRSPNSSTSRSTSPSRVSSRTSNDSRPPARTGSTRCSTRSRPTTPGPT